MYLVINISLIGTYSACKQARKSHRDMTSFWASSESFLLSPVFIVITLNVNYYNNGYSPLDYAAAGSPTQI